MTASKHVERLPTTHSYSQIITEQLYRDALGRFATGVAVVTTTDDSGRPIGATINSITSVSIRPPLVLWCLSTSAPSFSSFRDSPLFAINILPSNQRDLCYKFSNSDEDKFDGVGFRPDRNGLPLLDDALAHIVCSKWRRYPGGDHEIFVGQVRAIDVRDADPLIFYRGDLKLLDSSAAEADGSD